ncbi:MAG TPA: tetratricopeptide repeat protein [Bryobacteraceae bacterium]|nr:tetratricopeptide repeat protein [Bryobacteraceae bacterium]
MIRSLTATLVLALCAAPAWADENQLDTNPALFAVLAARAAAGYDSPDAPDAHPVRANLIEAILKEHPASLEDLKKFFAEHRAKDAEADLGQYISFALSIGDPPEFRYRYQPSELAPDAAPLATLEQLLTQFWNEAKLEALRKKADPAYEQALSFYHEPITKALFEANAYLRNPTSGYLGRRFQVYIELMGPPGLIQSRSLKDDYSVVISPKGRTGDQVQASADEQTRQVRHAYLHYVLDPLSVKYAAHLDPKKSLEDISDTAPALDESFKKDFLLLSSESLIKAVEARLSPSSQQAGLVDTALREGFILTPYFYDQLPVYEKQQESMRLYLPDMIDAIDLRKETRRLKNVVFAPAKLTVRPEQPVAAHQPQLTPSQTALVAAESLSFEKQYDKAKASFERVLQLPDEGALHARAYFGLGRIAAFQKDPELAEKLFQKTLEEKPDADTESWAQLYLGRLSAAAGDPDEAATHYRASMKVKGGSKQAQAEAEKALSAPAAARQQP